jgi:hypothetical protein
MWPNPRIPYQMSSDRARLAPLKGKPIMVNPVVAIEAAWHPAGTTWPAKRATRRGELLLGGIRHAVRPATHL